MVTVLAIVAAVLSAASILLHVVSPLTKSTLDDKIEAAVDKAIGLLPKP
jgi:Na+/proline symporter